MPTHQARAYRRTAKVKRAFGRRDQAERYEWAELLEAEGARIGALADDPPVPSPLPSPLLAGEPGAGPAVD